VQLESPIILAAAGGPRDGTRHGAVGLLTARALGACDAPLVATCLSGPFLLLLDEEQQSDITLMFRLIGEIVERVQSVSTTPSGVTELQSRRA
jgi:hypothetical protein